MKAYPPNLFERWPGDTGPEPLPSTPRVTKLFGPLYEYACGELESIATTLKSIKQQEGEDVFDRLYRRSHVLYGFASILGLPKATHLLAILEFACDHAREIETFEQYSMDYLVQLLTETIRGVLAELHAEERSVQDLSDVIDECRNYLDEPLQQCLAPVEPSPEEPVVSEAAQPLTKAASAPEPSLSGAVEPTLTVSPASKPAPEPPTAITVGDFDDGPEELDIAVDKIGLVSDFCEESRDNLTQIGQQLIELEDSADPASLVNDLFRSVHTVKGGARLLKIGKMETLAHQLESLLGEVRKGDRPVSANLIDILLDGKKLLEDMVDEVASNGPLRTRIRPCLQALAALRSATAAAPPAATSPTESELAAAQAQPTVESAAAVTAEAGESTKTAAPTVAKPKTAVPTAAKPKVAAGAETIRVPTEKLDDVLNNASEVFTTRIRLQSDVTAISSAINQFKQTLHQLSELDVHATLDRLAESNQALINDLWTLITRDNSRLTPDRLAALVNHFHNELAAKLDRQAYSTPEEIALNVLSIEEVRRRLQKNVEHLERLSTRLQTGATRFRMVPIASLFDRFPTQVRELGRQLGKKVKLDVRGADTKLDKVLINHLADPLLHIFRNAVDHGIEPPEERKQLGKPEAGQIRLQAYYHGSHAVVEVSDDGRGMDVDKIRAKAIERGLLEEEGAAAMSKQEILAAIFEPGFSMAAKVSNLSGRGVGMDVVKTAISQVQGSVTIDSALSKGTTIRMKLPLTLAVVGILLVEERYNEFAFPILNVEEILTIDKNDVQHFNKNMVYNHRGDTLPVTMLSSILEFPPSIFSDDKTPLVILSEGNRKIGILLDKILGREEVLTKNLGNLIKKVPFVMGCTILSNSRLVLILNASEIVNAKLAKPLLKPSSETDQMRNTRKQHRVLVVDDSAIQRKNLSAILSYAGYGIATADNGFEALKLVRQKKHYAAFCVDVVMPLMDGFEFVERLRHLPGHQSTPVVFITGRTSQQERDRAASLGVHAFFAKPVDDDMLIQTLDKYCLPVAGTDENSADSAMVEPV